MTRQSIDEFLKETNGNIIYIEQLLNILLDLGYNFEISSEIIKNYAKRYADKVEYFESQLKNKMGEDLADYIILKIRNNIHLMYWKCHEDVVLSRS